MTHEEFDKLVREVEAGLGRSPEALRRRVLQLAILGYLGLLAPVAFVLVLTLAFVLPAVFLPQDGLMLLLIGALIFSLGGYAAGRALWIRVPPPEGRKVGRGEAPRLFGLLDDLQTQLHSAPFHQVLIIPDFNAAVAARPRLGVFGWNQNYLLLGLPLMEGLSKEELTAVLAHECAHLSRRHHQSGQWIYRLRRSWELVFADLSRPRRQGEISLRLLLRNFAGWFWPRFNACAFVLSRAQEYEADALAAELAGKSNAAAALVRIGWYGRVLQEKFWPELWQLASSSPAPPPGVFLRIREYLPAISTQTERKWLEQAFSSTTTNADTHPSLSDRLQAIGCGEVAGGRAALVVPGPVPNVAADLLLGDGLMAIRQDLEKAWREKCAAAWLQQHKKAGVLQERLAMLDKTVLAQREDTDTLWDKARALLEMQQEEVAVPLLWRILSAAPGHAAANFHLGTFLLKSGDGEGEKYLERAIAENEELFPQAVNSFHAHYARTGQTQRIRELHARMDRHEKAAAASRQERSSVTAADTLIPHGLSETELELLRNTVAREADVLAVDVGRKELRYFVRQKLFLVGITIRPRWHRLPDETRDNAIVGRLLKTLQLPGRMLVFTPTGEFRSVARKLRRVPGARVWQR